MEKETLLSKIINGKRVSYGAWEGSIGGEEERNVFMIFQGCCAKLIKLFGLEFEFDTSVPLNNWYSTYTDILVVYGSQKKTLDKHICVGNIYYPALLKL